MERSRSTFTFTKAKVDDAGKLTGLLASFNTVDHGGDKILPGAFQKTLSTGKSYPLLWQHDSREPIGHFKATETSQGLQIDGQLVLSIQKARDARELLRAGVLKGLSIGYDTLDFGWDGDTRVLKELKLWEGSIVTFPMNEAAGVTSIKSSLSDAEKAKHLKSIEYHSRQSKRHQKAMNESLAALFDGFPDDEDDEDDGDNPALLEGGDEEMSRLIDEFKALLVDGD